MMLTSAAAARRLDAEAASASQTNQAAAEPTSGPYDAFTDEYWYHVHNQALRGQQDSLQQRRAAEERAREARRAYTGLTNILHRLRNNDNSPEPK